MNNNEKRLSEECGVSEGIMAYILETLCPEDSEECMFDREKSNFSCKHMRDLCAHVVSNIHNVAHDISEGRQVISN